MTAEPILPEATGAQLAVLSSEFLPLVTDEPIVGRKCEDPGFTPSSPPSSHSSLDTAARSAHEHPAFSLPTTQKAIVTPKLGPQLNQQARSISVRDPAIDEAIVRIEYTGICRSDACFSVGPEPGFPEHDHIAGHEGIGQVVKAHDPTLIGRTVGIRYLATSCQTCIYCLKGLPTSCPFQLNTSKHISGTFQQYATVPMRCLLLLPDSLMSSSTHHSLYTTALCSGSAALMALRSTNARPGDVIVIVGILGGIGHMAGGIAKNALGLKVIGVDLKWKIDALPIEANDFGHSFLPAAETEDAEEWDKFITSLHEECANLRPKRSFKRGAEAIVITSSGFGGFRRLEEYVCDGGTIVCSGVPRGNVHFTIPLPQLIERGLHVHGTLMGGNSQALQVMEYINTGILKPSIKVVGLDDVPEYMERLVKCEINGKIVVRVNDRLSHHEDM